MGKKLIFCVLLLSLSLFCLSADGEGDFDAIIDFDITLQDLDRLVNSEGYRNIQGDKLLILNGAISAIEVVSGEEEPFQAEIDLVSGKWIGMEDVEMYTCLVRVSGPEFEERIPVRRRREPRPDEITVNSLALVVGRLADVIEMNNGRRKAVVEGLHIRGLE